MSEDQFTRLFNYMQEQFDSIERKLDEKASQSSVDRLTNTIDGFVKRLDISEIEQAARDSQFNRLILWAKEVSIKTGIPLKEL